MEISVWEVLITTTCADEVSPPEIIKYQNIKPVEVPPESPFKIEFYNNPIENTLRAHLWVNSEKIETIQLNDNVLTAPKEKVYICMRLPRDGKTDILVMYMSLK